MKTAIGRHGFEVRGGRGSDRPPGRTPGPDIIDTGFPETFKGHPKEHTP
jgi:hypothetical protein